MLDHGGKLREAAHTYRIPLQDWLDLSTGIAPCGWPVAETLPSACWQRLPEEADGLEAAAKRYYGCGTLLPVAGSQAAIQALPTLRRPGLVGVPVVGYAEHAQAWSAAGHRLRPLAPEAIDAHLDQLDALLVINPNNPTGERFSVEQLLDWHRRLTQRGGCLVVDEAFMDCTPALSLAGHCPRPGLIVLRSLGKFFGLAGIRAGFTLAEPTLLDALRERLGPWALSGPTRWVAQAALGDSNWQTRQRDWLTEQGARLQALLEERLGPLLGGTALFQTLSCPDAAYLHQRLAHQGIFTRLFPEQSLLRFGLPAGEPAWRRLDDALAAIG